MPAQIQIHSAKLSAVRFHMYVWCNSPIGEFVLHGTAAKLETRSTSNITLINSDIVGTKRVSPFIRSEGVTVEVGSIDEETRSLHHILCYHTQTVQHVVQLTEKERRIRSY